MRRPLLFAVATTTILLALPSSIQLRAERATGASGLYHSLPPVEQRQQVTEKQSTRPQLRIVPGSPSRSRSFERPAEPTQPEIESPATAQRGVAIGPHRDGSRVGQRPRPVAVKRELPHFYKGLYLNNQTIRQKNRYEPMLRRAHNLDINVLVIDIQPRQPNEEFIQFADQLGFFLVARVVVFDRGLSTWPIPRRHLDHILKISEEAASGPFHEIQLDYIRFADRSQSLNLSLQQRYEAIASILKEAEARLRPHGVYLGADLFGRIAFNRNDIIGQRLELFSEHVDTIYPMLYPSHFYGDPARMRNPYQTIYDGTVASKQRVDGVSKIIPYIQAFRMSIAESGLTYEEYIRLQIAAAEDANGGGWVVWNSGNQYEELFNALDRQRNLRRPQKE